MNEQPFFLGPLDQFFLWYFALINSIYLVLLLLGSIKIFQRKKDLFLDDFTNIFHSNSLPEITFIIPAFNEESCIIKTIKNLETLSYPAKQVIVVNDGSIDHTLSLLIKELDLDPLPKYYDDVLPTNRIKAIYFSKKYPEFFVIDKENGGGKFDALNAGINASTNPYYIAIDADTNIDEETFLHLVKPILTDPSITAVGASVRIRNGCFIRSHDISTMNFPSNRLVMLQTLEYMRSFLERQGWDLLGGNFVLAGAFGMFHRDTIIKVGGYSQTVAEDMEIIIRLHRIYKKIKAPYKIRYLPDPVAWTDAPETLKELGHQRKNWQKGLVDSLWFHKSLFFNPQYGIFGCFVYPFFVLGEALEPFVEVLGILYILFGYFFGFVHPHFLLLFFIVTWGFNTIFTTLVIMVEDFSFNKYPKLKHLGFISFCNLIENFGYRQLTLIWRIKGVCTFLKNFKKVQNVHKTVIKKINKAIDS